jgi:hypothetical protein
LEFTPGSTPGARVLATLGRADEVPERWDDGLDDEEEEPEQETPVPTAPKLMMKAALKASRRRLDLQRLSFSSPAPRTPASHPRPTSFTSPPLQTPVNANLEAISNNPDLTKRQKKRQLKKYRNYLKDTMPEPEPVPQVFNVNEDDFPPLGADPPPTTMKRVVSSSAATSTSASTPVAIIARPRGATIPTGPALMSSPRTSSHHKAGSSTSWVSGTTGLRDKYERLAKNAGHFNLLASPFFPQNVGEFAAQLEYCQREKIASEQAKIAFKLREREKARDRPDVVEIEVVDGAPREEDGTYVVKALRLGKGWSGAYEKYISSDSKVERVSTANPAEEFHALEPMRMRVEKEHFVRVVDERAEDREKESTIWKQNYLEKRRAAWPDQNELKAEGEMRLRACGERRMPLPRLARYTEEAFTHKFENGVTAEELRQAKGEDILWYERELVKFAGVDLLASIKMERDSGKKIWDHTGLLPPAQWPAMGILRSKPGRGSPRGTTMVPQSPAGSSTPGYEMDGLTRNFASMGSHGFGDQRWVNAEAAGQRSASGPAAYRTAGTGFTSKRNNRVSGTWTDRSYSNEQYSVSQANGPAHQFGGRTSRASNHTAPAQHHSPVIPQANFSPYNPDDYADVFEDEEEPPPGGFHFDEETLRRLGVASLLDEM